MESLETKGQPSIEKGWVRVLLFLPIYLVVIFVAQIMAFSVLYVLPGWGMDQLMSLPSLLVTQAFVTLGALALVWLFTRNVDQTSFWSLGFRTKGYFKEGALGFAMGVGLIGMGFLLLYLLGNVEVKKVQFAPLYLLGYAIFTLFVAFNEEVVIRGYVLNNLMQSMNRWGALLLSAVLFTLLHSFNPGMSVLAIFNLFMAGLLLGIYYLYRKNLWFPIMLHLSWNFFQGSVFGFEVSGVRFSNSIIAHEAVGAEWLSGGTFGFEGSVLLTILLGLSLVALYFHFERKPSS